MCGRYRIDDSPAVIAEWMNAQPQLPDTWALRTPDDIRPTQEVPICLTDDDGGRTLQAARWGWQPSWSKRILINARREKLEESRVWRPLWLQQRTDGGRCLLPASAYFEWSAKQKYQVDPAVDHLVAFAGLWHVFPVADDLRLCAVILTTAAEGPASSVHSRMPVGKPRRRRSG